MDYDDIEDIENIEQIKNVLKEMHSHLQEIHMYQHYLHEIIPRKYKKFNPKPNENPFFNLKEIPNLQEREDAKKRMEQLFEINQ